MGDGVSEHLECSFVFGAGFTRRGLNCRVYGWDGMDGYDGVGNAISKVSFNFPHTL